MTLVDRLQAFRRAFPKRVASWPWLVEEDGRAVLYAVWVIGADYRNKTRYYGAYPVGYLARVMALFPDVGAGYLLHVFSGSLPPGPYTRCDVQGDAELRCSIYDLPTCIKPLRYRLVIADPPYSAADAQRYGTPMINRRKALAALAEVTEPGGYLVWLDTVWPMHAKTQWLTVGRILLQRSTNHRVRLVSIFERAA